MFCPVYADELNKFWLRVLLRRWQLLTIRARIGKTAPILLLMVARNAAITNEINNLQSVANQDFKNASGTVRLLK